MFMIMPNKILNRKFIYKGKIYSFRAWNFIMLLFEDCVIFSLKRVISPLSIKNIKYIKGRTYLGVGKDSFIMWYASATFQWRFISTVNFGNYKLAQ